MTHLNDYHDYFIIIDFINDPIVALPYPELFLYR
jgi:hypothetical protein